MNSVEGRISIVLEGSTFDGLPLAIALKAYGLVLADKDLAAQNERLLSENSHMRANACGLGVAHAEVRRLTELLSAVEPDIERLERVKKLFDVLDSTGWEDVNARNIVAALRKALT